jgi:hypothetical protein
VPVVQGVARITGVAASAHKETSFVNRMITSERH